MHGDRLWVAGRSDYERGKGPSPRLGIAMQAWLLQYLLGVGIMERACLVVGPFHLAPPTGLEPGKEKGPTRWVGPFYLAPPAGLEPATQ